jgi:radical SAM protein with 4Fe4S-binding SPASM domain
MEISPYFNYIEAYLTLRCNLSCSYCINKASSGVVRNRKELFGDEWVEILNGLVVDMPITLGGGEPTLHKDFYNIIRNVSAIKFDLLTNMTFDVFEFIKKVDHKQFVNDNTSYKKIRVSYHPKSMDPEILVLKCKELQDCGYSIGIFGINHPENISANVHMAELARKNQIYFFIKDFLGVFDDQLFGYYKYPKAISGEAKRCKCRGREILIAPDGNVYGCHRNLYQNKNEIGNVIEEDFELNDKFVLCNEYGLCNPCDVKNKTNRFLNMGNCSVEIVEVK